MTDVKPTTKHTDAASDPVTKASEAVKDATEKGHKGGTGTMMGAAAGAVAGAALGGIAGAALTDEKTRKVVGEKLGSIAKNAGETMKRLDDNKDELKKAASTLKDTAEPLQKTGSKKS